jgi:hypothetical protein
VRLAIAIGVIAIALAGALYLHQRQVLVGVVPSPGYNSLYADPTGGVAVYQHPAWEDPLAVLVALGGIAVAVGIAYRPGRRHASA